jgi:pilus assembly protein Flp/PilA
MSNIKNWTLKKYVAMKHREEGQGLAEYGLILALVAVLCVTALGVLQGGISGVLSSVGTSL